VTLSSPGTSEEKILDLILGGVSSDIGVLMTLAKVKRPGSNGEKANEKPRAFCHAMRPLAIPKGASRDNR
jgi:hypothetical protein